MVLPVMFSAQARPLDKPRSYFFAFAEDHGRKSMDECDGRNLRSSKEGASADSAEKRKDTTGVNPWGLHGEAAVEASQLG